MSAEGVGKVKFVSEVVSNNGPIAGLGRLNTTINGFVSANVYDLETGHETRVTDLSALSVKTIGFCKHRGILVKHTRKTALFHSFIEIADTVDCTPGFDFFNMDSASFVSGTAVRIGSDDIVVDTGFRYIHLTGELGSVAMWQDDIGTGYQYITLYEAIGRVCKKLGFNLMAYKRIFLYSKSRNYFSQIDLKHSHEADMFFTKMFVDVC